MGHFSERIGWDKSQLSPYIPVALDVLTYHATQIAFTQLVAFQKCKCGVYLLDSELKKL